jgi:hypothetical protein
MDSPRTLDLPPPQPLPARAARALGELEASTKLAVICLIFGWFFMNTLVVSLGSLEHGVRFFDMGAVIANPMRLFFGVDASLQRWSFGLICLVCVASPLAPALWPSRSAWLAYLAPLALMLVCGVILYWRTSGEYFVTPSHADAATSGVLRFANDLVRRGSGLVSRHIAVGAGGYLALIGCGVLAVQGIRRFRQRL